MTRRQTMPQQWLIADERMPERLWDALHQLPRGSGVLLLRELGAKDRRRLRRIASRRGFVVVTEGRGAAARVHDSRELTRAMLHRSRLVLISPIQVTRSHPDWQPLPRMRAATLARLAHREALALGGMDSKRYARIARLGFIGWAGISAFRI